jgi:molybdopterin synthase catalytic subunit
MMRFRFTESAIDAAAARRELLDRGAGGYVSFEGWVRDHNEGQEVTRLEYEAFQALALKEGEKILAEAVQRFPVKRAACIHRVGSLDLSDMAVWVGVSSAHRGEAFDACRFIIDEVKHRVPIWKKEHYRSGDSGWVNCERCAAEPQRREAGGAGHHHGGAGHHHDRNPLVLPGSE